MKISKGLGISEAEKFFIQQYLNNVIEVTQDGLIFNNKTKRYIGATGSGRYPKISMARANRKDVLHIQIHRLVWIIFKGDIPKDKEIHHKDNDRENRDLDNLELVDHSTNMKFALSDGLLNPFPLGNNYHLNKSFHGNRYAKSVK